MASKLIFRGLMSSVAGCGLTLACAGPAAAEESILLETITVTASKIEEDIQTFDGAIAVKTGDDLRAANVQTVGDLEKVFPGLVIRTRGNRAFANFTVRGISSPDYYSPAVQVYIDGIPQQPSAIAQPLADIERVEFLKGPQGTLYGRNALAGVINIVTRSPDRQRLSTGVTITNNKVLGHSAATLPVVPDTLFLDASVAGDLYQGELDNISTGESNINGSSDVLVRGRLRYRPLGSAFDADLSGSFERLYTREEFYLPDGSFDTRTYDQSRYGPYPLLKRTTATGAAKWNWHLSDITVTGISTVQDVKSERDLVSGGIVLPFTETDLALSQEIRAAYDAGGAVTWLAGAFYQHDRFKRVDEDGYSGFYGPSANVVETDSLAGFAEASWQFAPRFDVTAGGRLSYDRSSIDFDRADIYSNGYGFAFTNSDSFVGFEPKISLGYSATESLHFYGLASRGYKPGGFNHAVSSSADSASYDPETAWNFEIGARGSLFQDAVTFSAAAYHIISTDKQIYVGPVGSQVIQNAGEATSTGVELSALWRPVTSLQLSGTLNAGRSIFTDFTDPLTGETYDDNHLPYAPDVTGRAEIRYFLDQQWFDGDMSVYGSANFTGKQYFDEANTLSQDAVTTFNAGLDVALENQISASLFVENIADELYRTSSFDFGSGDIRSTVSQGRTFGLSLNMTF